MGMHEMREELEDLAFHELNPEAYTVVSERLDALEAKNVGLVTEIEQQLKRKLLDRGIDAEGVGAAQARLFHLAQDGAQIDRFRAALRHLRLPRNREDATRVLPGARDRSYDVAGGAGPLQGLRLDPEAE
jgi:hypothetical protein